MSEFSERMKRRFLGGRPSWERAPAVDYRLHTSNDRSTDYVVEQLPKLSANERGAVWPILPGEAFLDDDSIAIRAFATDHGAIRTTLLFCDVIDIPEQNGLGGVEWCASEFASIGALRRSKLTITGAIEPAIRDAPFIAFLEHDKREPGRWSISRPAQTIGVPAKELSVGTGFALTLQNALPIFSREVSLQEVAEFKARRFDELLALRDYLDQLTIEVAANGPNRFAESVAFEQFDRSLAAYVTVMNESNWPKIWQSVKASIDVTTIMPGAIEAALTQTISANSLVGAVATIGIKTAMGMKRKRNHLNPFEYLTSAHLEL